MGGQILYKSLVNKLKNNYTIIIYKISSRLLNENIDATTNHFNIIKKDIISTANYLESKMYKEFSILGNSLLCCSALMVANSDARFKKVILNLVGSDIAECLWYTSSSVARHIKNKILKDGIKLYELKKYWKNISPINNINNFKNRKLLVLLSKNDKIIKYKYGLRFLKGLKKENINYELEIDNIFGHYLSGLKQLQFSNKIIDFINLN